MLGRQRRVGPSVERGFTLVEILVVITIIVCDLIRARPAAIRRSESWKSPAGSAATEILHGRQLILLLV